MTNPKTFSKMIDLGPGQIHLVVTTFDPKRGELLFTVHGRAASTGMEESVTVAVPSWKMPDVIREIGKADTVLRDNRNQALKQERSA